MVAVAGDENNHIVAFQHAQLVGLQSHQYIDTLFPLAAMQVFHGQVVCLHPIVHEYVVEDAVVVELVRFLARILGTEAATEEVRIDDVAEVWTNTLFFSHHVLQELVQSSDMETATVRVHIVVVVAHVGEVTPIIEHANFYGAPTSIRRGIHVICDER